MNPSRPHVAQLLLHFLKTTLHVFFISKTFISNTRLRFDPIRKIWLISKIRLNLVTKPLQYRYCQISHEVKAIRKRNLVAREILFFKSHAEDEKD